MYNNNMPMSVASTQLQRLMRGRAVRRLAEMKDARPKSLASSWMAAVAVQRMWRGLNGRRKLGQVGCSMSTGRARSGLKNEPGPFFPCLVHTADEKEMESSWKIQGGGRFAGLVGSVEGGWCVGHKTHCTRFSSRNRGTYVPIASTCDQRNQVCIDSTGAPSSCFAQTAEQAATCKSHGQPDPRRDITKSLAVLRRLPS